MNGLSFEYPWVILLLVPLIYCLYACREKEVARYFVHLQWFVPKKGWWRQIVILLVLTALVVALSSPVRLDKQAMDKRLGRDIVLVLDGSGSMGALGFDTSRRESRFETLKRLASNFVLKRIHDNVGVVYYGDFAFIASPVTYEKAIVAEMIGYLNDAMAGQNTAIGEGIAMGVRALEHSKAQTKIMVLLSDGEHNSGRISPEEAVSLALLQQIKIYTIGIGDDALDETLLRHIADESDGSYFFAADAAALQKIYGYIDALEQSPIKSSEYFHKTYLYSYLLLLALAGMLLLLYNHIRRV
ncbi:MAG: hypothetical protein DSZ03_06985 [Sulfurimonas sp.]|nr:MAG: hypothetical protein DSZ03_06985 [Sulfurimonas sp.]